MQFHSFTITYKVILLFKIHFIIIKKF